MVLANLKSLRSERFSWTLRVTMLFRETETTSEKLAKNVQDVTKKIGLDSEKLMDGAEKYFEKAKNYEFTQTPEGNENL